MTNPLAPPSAPKALQGPPAKFLAVLGTIIALTTSQPAVAEVTFDLTFEPGSKWFTESYSDEARSAMESFFSGLGEIFDATATVSVAINDNETSAYASTGSAWYDYVTLDGLDGEYYAPASWVIINKGIDKNGPDPDVTVNWNMDVDGLYSGNPNRLIDNFRGLGRHELHHAFGSVSFFSHSSTSDPRGTERTATVASTMIFDRNDDPILETYNNSRKRFLIADYSINDNWNGDNSGLYFAGRDGEGNIVQMPLKSYSTSIDYSHISGIAYVSDHPTWSTYENTDFNFLRAMGYSLTIDRPTYVPISEIEITSGNVDLQFDSQVGVTYQVQSSINFLDWTPASEDIPGTGLQILHQLTHLDPPQPKLFFRIKQLTP